MAGPHPTALYARLVVSLRWLVPLAVAAGAWAAVTMLPTVGSGGGQLALLTSDGPAIQAQTQAVERFGLPLIARSAVVQRDPHGLNHYTAARAVLHALQVDKQTVTSGGHPPGNVVAALPLINTPVLVPGAAEQNTTVVTYLFTGPSASLVAQSQAAHNYANQISGPDSALVGVTGTTPIVAQQGQVIRRGLPAVEIATLAAIAVIVGLNFRSVIAPVVTLVTAGVGYLIANHAIGASAASLGLSAPSQLEPIIVALMLGITTDYSIFFMSGLRRRLRSGQVSSTATVDTVREYLPIVLTAGFTVACGVAAIVVAGFALFRAFGPGLAITVLVGLTVAVTMVPALLGILGRGVFWPSRFRRASAADPPQTPTSDHEHQDGQDDQDDQDDQASPSRRARLVGRLENRKVAATVVVVMVVVLLAAASPLTGLSSAVAPADGLPPGNPVRVAATAAGAGFAPGITAPTEVIVSAPGITARRDALARLAAELHGQPGVEIVLSPGERPVPVGQNLGLFLAPHGDAARYLVVFGSDPLGASAISQLRELQHAMPRLLAAAGLTGAQTAYAGDTALGMSLVDKAHAAIDEVAIAVGLVILALLIVFLRALVAPLYLLVSSVLSVAAALGLTTVLFQGALGNDGLIFYVPFTAGVLLISLGNDYNIFSVGYIWEQARHRTLQDAMVVALPRSTRAINAAGLALAASFAVVALIPLSAFRELAFAVAAGILIDTFLVRTFLVPALISLVGRASGWPGTRLVDTAGSRDS